MPDLALIESVLGELLSAMVADGGGAEIISFENGVVTLRLLGTCLFCPSRRLSADALSKQLQLHVPGLTAVNILYPTLSK